MPPLQGLQERIRHRQQLTNGELETETEIDLRNLNTVESLHTLGTKNSHCGEGVRYGEVAKRLINMRIFLRKYDVTCCDQFMLTVSHTIVDPMDNLCLLQQYKWNTTKMRLPRLIINAP